jgi:hypothetical protein
MGRPKRGICKFLYNILKKIYYYKNCRYKSGPPMVLTRRLTGGYHRPISCYVIPALCSLKTASPSNRIRRLPYLFFRLLTFLCGGSPNKRLYSLMNCVTLSYPTAMAARVTSYPSDSIRRWTSSQLSIFLLVSYLLETIFKKIPRQLSRKLRDVAGCQ